MCVCVCVCVLLHVRVKALWLSPPSPRQTIVLEQKGEDGTWPRASKNVSYSQHQTRSSDDDFANSSSGKSSR